MMQLSPLRTLDIFAGIGSMRFCFEQVFGTRMETVFVAEKEKFARDTYFANFPTEVPYTAEIGRMRVGEIPPFDLCLAGFSQRNFSDPEGKTWHERCAGLDFFEVARLCDYHQPKVIFCDQSRLILNQNRFQLLKKSFEELGYTVFSKLINSINFGVPQIRERLYIVCFRKDIAPASFEFPYGNIMQTRARIRDILDKEPILSRYYLSDVHLRGIRKRSEKSEREGDGKRYAIRNLDGPAVNIMPGSAGISNNLICDKRRHALSPNTYMQGTINDEYIRRFSPREWARLQGFPESFIIKAQRESYKHIAKSVVIPVGIAIAEYIAKVLEEKA